MAKGGISLFTRGLFRVGRLYGSAIELKPGRTITANATLSAADSGRIVYVGAADLVVSIPATVSGYVFALTLLPAGLSAGLGLSVSPVALDSIYGNGFTVADDKDAILSGTGDRAGDNIVLIGDGGLGYNIQSFIGTWTRQA
jgi:hypothetical protein